MVNFNGTSNSINMFSSNVQSFADGTPDDIFPVYDMSSTCLSTLDFQRAGGRLFNQDIDGFADLPANCGLVNRT